MYQIDEPGAPASMPAIPAAAAAAWFQEGDPVNGLSLVAIRAWWLNQIQAELLAFLNAANVTPNKANTAQVLGAAMGLFQGRNFQVFSNSGSWVAPANITAVEVMAWGGGGAGGAGGGGAGGGGAGGGFWWGITAITPGTSYPITIGAGGMNISPAGNGGTTSFGSLISVTGGTGGPEGAANTAVQGSTGAGNGFGPGSGVGITGAYGGNGIYVGGSAPYYQSGAGGNAFGTTGGLFGQASSGTNIAGGGAYGPGGGGAGGLGTSSGGSGSPGLIILRW